ncbi:MAG: general secretion pathway protein GspK [Myxococcota bacterium]
MVLGALTILTVMLTELQDASSAEFSSALEARDALVAEYAARSAVNLSRLLIASEPTVRKAVAPIMMILFSGEAPQIPVWNFADRMLGPFNDKSGNQDFADFSGINLALGKNLGFPGARFELNIVDEDAKFNVNAASRGSAFGQQRQMLQLMELMAGAQYNPMFEHRDKDGNYSDRQAICSAIIDWVDPDLDTMNCDPTLTTAQSMPPEDSYYQNLRRPYQRKNAAFDSLEELRRVRGITDDFWSTFVDPEPEHPEKRRVTVWGQSNAINVNSASAANLLTVICGAAVPNTKICVDPLERQKFLMIYELMKSFTMGAPPFGSPGALVNLIQGKGMMGPLVAAAGLEPIVLKSPDDFKAQLVTVSKVFSVYATGIVKSGSRESRVHIHAVIDFRNAPAPGNPTAGTGATGATGTGTTGAGTGMTGTGARGQPPTSAANAAAAAQQDAIAALTRPNPAGNVVYFKMD